MARKVFYSFHYKADAFRVAKIRNIGAIEGNLACRDNDWEAIVGRGKAAIERWIDDQMRGTSCTIVMIGRETAGRPWINYEIEKTWENRKGLLGIHIHNLLDHSQFRTSKGANPFDRFTLNNGKEPLSKVVKTYDPPHSDSGQVYEYIRNNIQGWVETAIEIRSSR